LARGLREAAPGFWTIGRFAAASLAAGDFVAFAAAVGAFAALAASNFLRASFAAFFAVLEILRAFFSSALADRTSCFAASALAAALSASTLNRCREMLEDATVTASVDIYR